ncbi:MAG: methyltransferase domain-containing protein [Gemmatimonadales bacterium]|nr:methyltransferase domain-containing protein [Gemmatimonadales bacterium]
MGLPVSGPAPREDADLETASEGYAQRFSGPVGRWFLELQARTTMALLDDLPRGSTVLDVSGGHAQIAPALLAAGYEVTIAGSSEASGALLADRLGGARYRFEVADLDALPYADGTFTAVTCFRLLPHSVGWERLLGELCRVARRAVVIDYPSSRSVNRFADRLFGLKKRIEQNTRPFELFHPRQIREAFGRRGFEVRSERPQFLLPMVLYRLTGSVPLARTAEWPGRRLGLTRMLGSPVIIRADRVGGE